MIQIIIGVIAVEAMTEILMHSELFGWLRRLLRPIHLDDCPWCLSVWVAIVALVLIVLNLGWLLIPFVIHRLSNLFHEIYKLFRR